MRYLEKAKMTNLDNKKKIKLEFYEQRWFKLICFFTFFGWLFYITHTPFEIEKNELVELSVTVDKEWKSGGNRNPIKLYFNVKEYSNRFGIYVGGIYGRWTEVTQTLQQNAKIKIRIHESNENKLNKENEVIPIYYLKNNKSDIVFNEDNFNEGEKSSSSRVLAFFIIIFILGLWKILTE
ncbi:hypothetical protein GSF70_02265 [Flavobacteriaceae bacterium W22]|nr:hypothetical protein [Flavobacteriaceae bacterium W22]